MTIQTDPAVDPTEVPTETVQTQAVPVTEFGETGEPVAAYGVEEEVEPEQESVRTAVAMSFPVIAAGIMVGGIYIGFSPRIFACLAGLLGLALAVGTSQIKNRLGLTYVLILGGLFGIGLLMVGLSSPGDVFGVQSLVSEVRADRAVSRPPVDFDLGWRALVGWVMGIVGFGVGWVALAIRRPALGLLIPLPIAAVAGISVPESAQKVSGLAVLILFCIGLGLLASEQAAGEDGTRPPISYEIRKALKAIPLLAAITVALVLLTQVDFLFPDSLYDPAEEPQKPKPQPLSEVKDRVLFATDSPDDVTGPWRMGVLDVYDGSDWRLPPFASNRVEEVPKDGIVDDDLEPNLEVTFTVAGLGGAVLPGLPNTVGISARGAVAGAAGFDTRSGNIRLVNGAAEAGMTYTVLAASPPSVDDLKAVTDEVPDDIKPLRCFGKSPGEDCSPPEAPPAVQGLLDSATGESLWERFDFARTWILNNIVVSGKGTPISITPQRLDEMIGVDKKGSPFEIVAAQAMLARYLGLPSRIGYGFDGGEEVNDKIEVRPRHGAAFVEVYFPGFKWLPVIGTPLKAEPTVGSNPDELRTEEGILPSDDIAVEIFMPTVVPPQSVFAEQLARVLLIAIVVVLLALLVYTLLPAIRKTRMRARRRAHALESGTRARIALAYTEWRDYATDFGFQYSTDTPLMFLDRFVDDDEHAELAWLTTRVLWGDLQHDSSPVLASVAEELSRSLRRRLAATQPATVRAVAMVSRLSLRDPYAPEMNPPSKRELREQRKEFAREAEPVG